MLINGTNNRLGKGYIGEVIVYDIRCKILSFDQKPGEIISSPSKIRSDGTLQITNYAATFSADEDADISFRIPIGIVASINISKQDHNLSIDCKDCRVVIFELSSQVDRDLLFQHLYFCCFCQNVEQSFPFHYNLDVQQHHTSEDGWNIYDALAEYLRLGISTGPDWRITDINKNFSVCDSYQPILAVSSSVTDNDIVSSSVFR